MNFTFDGTQIERRRGVRVLNHEELLAGDVSLAYVSRLMHRRYTEAPTFRKVLQTLWYQVNNGQEIFVIGRSTTTTRCAAAPAGARSSRSSVTSRCSSSIRTGMLVRVDRRRLADAGREAVPVISHLHFTGTGTRTLRENGKKAIDDLFRRSFQ